MLGTLNLANLREVKKGVALPLESECKCWNEATALSLSTARHTAMQPFPLEKSSRSSPPLYSTPMLLCVKAGRPMIGLMLQGRLLSGGHSGAERDLQASTGGFQTKPDTLYLMWRAMLYPSNFRI